MKTTLKYLLLGSAMLFAASPLSWAEYETVLEGIAGEYDELIESQEARDGIVPINAYYNDDNTNENEIVIDYDVDQSQVPQNVDYWQYLLPSGANSCEAVWEWYEPYDVTFTHQFSDSKTGESIHRMTLNSVSCKDR